MRGACAAVALAALLLARTSPAAGAAGEDQAKALFTLGAQAYERGQYAAAIQAFDQAYKLAPRPGILFSMAQAYRRQFFVDERGENLDKAIALYREYLEKVPQGGRRGDVAQALGELEPIAARRAASSSVAQVDAAQASGAAEGVGPPTRLMVSSQVDEALVSVDGGQPAELPFIEEITPGKHTLKVTAPGYFDDAREVVTAEGGVVALDIPLREKPARLTIAAEVGSDISIDGRLAGVAPLPQPLELPAGRHLVTVARSGRRPFAREVVLARDEKSTIFVALETTTQRYAALAFVGVGIAGAAAGGLFSILSLGQQNVAEQIKDQTTAQGNLPPQRRQAYVDALNARDELGRVAGVAFGVGVISGGVGTMLYLTDYPKAGPAPSQDEQPRTPAPERRRGEPSMEVSAAPLLAPGFAGASVVGRF